MNPPKWENTIKIELRKREDVDMKWVDHFLGVN